MPLTKNYLTSFNKHMISGKIFEIITIFKKRSNYACIQCSQSARFGIELVSDLEVRKRWSRTKLCSTLLSYIDRARSEL